MGGGATPVRPGDPDPWQAEALRLAAREVEACRRKLLEHRHGVPAHTFDDLEGYVLEGQPPGDFLREVLNDRLTRSFAAADDENARCMQAIARLVYQAVPTICRGNQGEGSERWVDLWLQRTEVGGRWISGLRRYAYLGHLDELRATVQQVGGPS